MELNAGPQNKRGEFRRRRLPLQVHGRETRRTLAVISLRMYLSLLIPMEGGGKEGGWVEWTDLAELSRFPLSTYQFPFLVGEGFLLLPHGFLKVLDLDL